MAIIKSAIIYISLVLSGVAHAQSNPYLTYVTLCPSASIRASSAKVQSCEQSIYTAVMSRPDCQPVPVASCECEWFNSWVSTCLPNICPNTGVDAIASSQGSIYCTPTGDSPATATGGMTTSTSGGQIPATTGMTTAAGATVTSAPGGGTPATTGSQGAATTTSKTGDARGLMVPFASSFLVGFVGIAIVLL
ncbi:hypothetical protein ABW20_dc0109259 [Dactylellina cionopaga]|nr:hypothetical protein ABW20_dc0109259 [Dactylellina cionopaga]